MSISAMRPRHGYYSACLKQMHRGYTWVNDLAFWIEKNPNAAMVLPSDLWNIIKRLVGWPRIHHLAQADAEDIYPWRLDHRNFGDY